MSATNVKLKNFLFSFFTLFFLFLLIPDIANAGYLDPGAGSTLVQSIIAALAYLKRFWKKIFGLSKD